MIDHPLQLVVSLALLGLVGWRMWSVRRGSGRERFRARHWSLRWLGRIGSGLAVVVLAVSVLDATTLVRANLCIELGDGKVWCNHGDAEMIEEATEADTTSGSSEVGAQ